MNKNVSKAIGDDQEKRAKPRYTRLLLDDDRQVMERTDAPSTLIADLVHKGLAYEALAKGADDPTIRNLLRTFDQMIGDPPNGGLSLGPPRTSTTSTSTSSADRFPRAFLTRRRTQ